MYTDDFSYIQMGRECLEGCRSVTLAKKAMYYLADAVRFVIRNPSDQLVRKKHRSEAFCDQITKRRGLGAEKKLEGSFDSPQLRKRATFSFDRIHSGNEKDPIGGNIVSVLEY